MKHPHSVLPHSRATPSPVRGSASVSPCRLSRGLQDTTTRQRSKRLSSRLHTVTFSFASRRTGASLSLWCTTGGRYDMRAVCSVFCAEAVHGVVLYYAVAACSATMNCCVFSVCHENAHRVPHLMLGFIHDPVHRNSTISREFIDAQNHNCACANTEAANFTLDPVPPVKDGQATLTYAFGTMSFDTLTYVNAH